MFILCRLLFFKLCKNCIAQLEVFLKKIRLLTWGLITEQKPKSVPKKGRKLVVFLDNFSEPNLKYKER